MDFHLTINGWPVAGARELEVVNPASGQVFERCACADAAQLDAAVEAAEAAFPAWSIATHADRMQRLSSLANAITAEVGRLAELLTSEQGKPLGDAIGEIMASAAMIRFFAAFELRDEVVCDDHSARILVQRAPLGVVAIITPWNSPVLMLANKLAPALRAGNTVVCKPAASTPLTALAIGSICRDIFPPGVVNVITDANDLGDRLVAHRAISKISFTGSTAIGRKVMAGAAGGITPITLELGGNDAAIVLDDADVAATAPQILAAAMRNAGQVCMATKRAYVPDNLYDEMCDTLAQLAGEIVVGNGLEKDVAMGPIQNLDQFQKVLGYLKIAHRDGNVIAGGAPIEGPGNFIAPTIVRDVIAQSPLVTEEQFGPILPVVRYSNIDDVIGLVNASPYGLGGTIWCGDTARGEAVARQISSGIIWVNTYMDLRFDVAIGGVKSSGMGLEMGLDGLLAYMRRTVIHIKPARA